MGNVLWEWAFAYVNFVDEYGEDVSLGQNFSHPRPVVEIGKNASLEDFAISDVSLTAGAPGSNPTVSLTIHGKVTSDLADIVEDGKADINEVTLIVPTISTENYFERIEKHH